MYRKWFLLKCNNKLKVKTKKGTQLVSFFVLLIVNHILLLPPILSAGNTQQITKKPKYTPQALLQLPPLLLETEKKYTQHKTFQAQFTQIDTSILLAAKQKEKSGTLQIKKPKKIRWETLQPDPQSMISDGKMYWIYTPPFAPNEAGQMIEKRASDVQSQWASSLLEGNFNTSEVLNINSTQPNTFVLQPMKNRANGIKQITLKIDTSSKWIQSILIEHIDGNQSQIELSDIQADVELSDSLFSFKPPAHTDLIHLDH